jgi:hypothetical protein
VTQRIVGLYINYLMNHSRNQLQLKGILLSSCLILLYFFRVKVIKVHDRAEMRMANALIGCNLLDLFSSFLHRTLMRLIIVEIRRNRY